jgi:hypothetical protein
MFIAPEKKSTLLVNHSRQPNYKYFAPDGAKTYGRDKTKLVRIDFQGLTTRARLPGGGGEGWAFL